MDTAGGWLKSLFDAIRAGCAEAKNFKWGRIGLMLDAIRAGCAEAKTTFLVYFAQHRDAIRAGCAEAKLSMAARIWPRGEMRSVRGVPKQTEGHCIQTIMCRTMK